MAVFPGQTVATLLLLLLNFQTLWTHSEGHYSIAGSDYEYSLKENGKTCLYAAFKLKFTLCYYNESSVEDILDKEVILPPHSESNVSVSGRCNESSMILSWNDVTDFGITVQFKKNLRKHWWLSRIGLNFTFNNATAQEERIQSFWTADNTKLFDRTFYHDEYFYCKTAKMYYLTTCKGDHCVSPCLNDNKTCSYVEMDDSVLYPGDIHGDKPDRKLCEEDYIRLQEIIVPVVVGGVLSLLLILILVAYVVAYIHRKRKEKNSQYETVDN